jgi:hypothetical protein
LDTGILPPPSGPITFEPQEVVIFRSTFPNSPRPPVLLG